MALRRKQLSLVLAGKMKPEARIESIVHVKKDIRLAFFAKSRVQNLKRIYHKKKYFYGSIQLLLN
jgi:hypothetical protein